MFMSPMYLELPPVVSLLMGAAVLGVVVGVLWILRIGDLGEGPGRPILRRPAEDAPLRRLPERRHLARPGLPDAIWRRLTVRWFVTRLELAVAVACVALASAPFWLLAFVGYVKRPMFVPPWFDLLPVLGLAGAVIGLAWMIRIARAPAETGRPVWRSRDD